MAPNISGVVRAKATIEASTDAEVFNYSIASANTEYSITLPSTVKQFHMRVRENNALLKFTFTATESGTKYFTVPRGTSFTSTPLTSSLTIYFQATDVCTLEVLAWK